MLNHELRQGRITSSTIAAVLGIDPWTTPLAAWARIRDPAKHDNVPEYDADKLDHFTRGHILEGALVHYGALALAADKKSLVVTRKPGTIPHPHATWAADTIDAIYELKQDGAEYGSEAKSVAWSDPEAKAWGEPWTDQVPAHVRVQCDWHLWHHPQLRTCIVPTLIGSGHTLRCYVVGRDEERVAELVEYASAWHNRYIVGDELPEPQAGDDEVVRNVFRNVELDTIEATPALISDVIEDVRLRIAIAQLEQERSAVRARLAVAMRFAQACDGEWGRVTYRKSKDSQTTDWKAIAECFKQGLIAVHDESIKLAKFMEANGCKLDNYGQAGEQEAWCNAVIAQHTKPKPGHRTLRTHVPGASDE